MAPKVALLFEDNPLCRDLITEILREKDFKVTSFTSPTHYLSDKANCCCCSDEACADALITDNQMPGMTGLELLQSVKNRGCKLPNHRKAIISGSWSDEEYRQALQLGCKIFQKPVSIEEIHQWLDDRH